MMGDDEAEMLPESFSVAIRSDEIEAEMRNAPLPQTPVTMGDLRKMGYAGADIRPGDDLVLGGWPYKVVSISNDP